MKKVFALVLVAVLAVNMAFALTDETGFLWEAGASGIIYYYESEIEVVDTNGNWEIDTTAGMATIPGCNVSVVSTIYAWDANLYKTELVTDATYDMGPYDSDNSRSLGFSLTRSSSVYDDWEIFSCVSYHVGSEDPGVFYGFYDQTHDWYENWAASSPNIDYDNYTDVSVDFGQSRQATYLSPDSQLAVETNLRVDQIESKYDKMFAKDKNKFLEDYYFLNMINLGAITPENSPFINEDSIKAFCRLQFFEVLRNEASEGDEAPSYWISDDGKTLYVGIVKSNGNQKLFKSKLMTTESGWYYWTALDKVNHKG